MSVLAGTDFFTAEVLTCRGLVTYYVLFFIHLDTRRVSIAGITEHPDSVWMEQVGRDVTWEGWGFLQDRRYLLHDRDTKFSESFRDTVMAGGVKPLKLPARRPNLNSFAERWVRSVKEECLSKLVLFGEGSLRRAVGEYVTHFLEERNHQGKGNVLLFPPDEERIPGSNGAVHALQGKATGRHPEVLSPRGRMSFLTIRDICISRPDCAPTTERVGLAVMDVGDSIEAAQLK